MTMLLLLACGLSRGDREAVPSGPLPVDHSPAADPEIAQQVEDLALDFLADQEMVTLGVALVHDGAVCYSGGFGWADLAAERPLGHRTPILLSSVSKTFVGVAAMQAVESGAVDLDARVDTHLSFPVDNPRVEGDAVSLRDLLTHNSGLEDSSEVWGAYAPGDPEIPLAEFMEGYVVPGGAYYKRSNWAGRAPGDGFAYSNSGAALAGLALGEAAGLEFMDLVARDILTPLGMDDSAYLLADLSDEPAVPYDSARGGEFRPYPQYGYPTYPDGMLRSSAHDMARYIAAIAGNGSLEGMQLLSEDSLGAMLTVDPSAGTDEDGQAIAWAMRELDGVPMMGHNGGDFGSLVELWLDPETGDGFVLLTTHFPNSWEATLQLESDLMALAAGCPAPD